MPPWRASRGLVLGLLACLSVTESVASPTQRHEADHLTQLGTTATSGEATTPLWVRAPTNTVTATSKRASPEPQDVPRREAQKSHSKGEAETTVTIVSPSNQTGVIVVLLLVLLALLVTLTGAWCKLREYGGAGAYYPWQMESGARGPPRWARVLRSVLPGRAPSQQGDLEAEDRRIVDEEDEGEDEEDEEEPGSDEEEGGIKFRGEGDSLSDYSSLGGIDLRERAGESADGDDGSLPPPPSSPRGSQVLDGLHSLAGSAGWGETGQDVTAL